MSRIYEALRRAEAERAAAQGTLPADAPVEPAEAPLELRVKLPADQAPGQSGWLQPLPAFAAPVAAEQSVAAPVPPAPPAVPQYMLNLAAPPPPAPPLQLPAAVPEVLREPATIVPAAASSVALETREVVPLTIAAVAPPVPPLVPSLGPHPATLEATTQIPFPITLQVAPQPALEFIAAETASPEPISSGIAPAAAPSTPDTALEDAREPSPPILLVAPAIFPAETPAQTGTPTPLVLADPEPEFIPAAIPAAIPEPAPDLQPAAAAGLPALPAELAPPPELAPAEPLAAPAIPAFDFDRVASAVWTPLIAQLPGVQERGRAAEQFRGLRSRLQEFRGSNRLKSILISSGLPQEGKSFVAANLALALARDGASRVLLIDGDLQNPSLHRIFGCPHKGPGLGEYLAGQATLEQILRRPEADPGRAPLPNGFAALVLITAGTKADQAADLAGNGNFDALMAQVTPHFDWILVDSSAVNLVPDGVHLARSCDGVLLIARGAVTRLETAQRAVAALESCRLLGVVLNAINDGGASRGQRA